MGLVLTVAGGSQRGFFAIAQAWNVLAGLGFAFIFPALLLTVDRGGLAAGLDLGTVIQTSRANPMASLGAALICILAGVLGLLGLVVCGVGVVFTEAYAGAVIVAAVAWFERQLAANPTTT